MISQDASEAWELHLHYERLAEGPSANSVMKDWQPALRKKAKHMGSIACLKASYVYQGSRKKAEQALEYSALLKAIEFAVEDAVRSEAQYLIEQPRGRRLKTSLSALTEPAEFHASNYFSPVEMQTAIPFTLPKSLHAMLAELLPLTIASAPLILSEKLKNYVEKEICSQLYNINRCVRSVMVKCNSPCSIELLRSSSAVPMSLVHIGARIRKKGGLKRLQEMLELGSQEAEHCNAVICSVKSPHADKDELEALQDCVTAGLNALNVIQSKLERSAHLIEILDRGEPYIGRFLGKLGALDPARSQIDTSKHRLHRSSAFFDKADAFFRELGEQIGSRSQKCVELEARAKEYNFFNPVMSLIDSCPEPKEWSLKDLKDCFDAALAEFEADKMAIQDEKLKAEESIQGLLRLENELRRYRHDLAKIDQKKLNAAQSLMFAALEFYDISYNLSESSRYYSTLNTAVANFKDRCTRATISIKHTGGSIHDMKTGPGEYTWQPGRTINFI